MSFWSWGEPTPQDETQTASFWRWGEPATAPTPTQPEAPARRRRPLAPGAGFHHCPDGERLGAGHR